jgi:hypothetical protein
LENRKPKKVEKQQNKRGEADMTRSRGDEEATEQRTRPGTADFRRRLAASRPSPPSPSSIPFTGHRRRRRRITGVGSGSVEELDPASRGTRPGLCRRRSVTTLGPGTRGSTFTFFNPLHRRSGGRRAVAGVGSGRPAAWEARRTTEELDLMIRGGGERKGTPDLGEERQRRRGQQQIYTSGGGKAREAKMMLQASRSALMIVRRSPHGGVVEVASPSPPLVHLSRVVPVFGALLIDELMAFLPDVICIFYLDVIKEFQTHCYIHIFVDWIKEVVVVVV